MPSTGSEPMASSPLWLAYSGLPRLLTEKVSRAAWLVFKTVVEIDCERNARPATIEIAPSELAERCGLPDTTVMRTLEGLRRKKCLALFLPEHAEETALIEVQTPLPTPFGTDEVRRLFPFNTLPGDVRLRYGDPVDEARAEARLGADRRDLERVIDLYFNTVGFKMNSFILDELRLVYQRFAPEEVEKTFARAEKNGIRSLGWVVRELYRRRRTDETRRAKARDGD